MSESDTDPMASSSDTPLYRNNIISVGRAVSQPNVFGLGLINSIDDLTTNQRSSLETRAAEVLRRFEVMKTDISKWKTSEEHHFVSIN